MVSRIDFVSISSWADPDQTTNQPICVDILHPPTRSQKTKKKWLMQCSLFAILSQTTNLVLETFTLRSESFFRGRSPFSQDLCYFLLPGAGDVPGRGGGVGIAGTSQLALFLFPRYLQCKLDRARIPHFRRTFYHLVI